jgi:protease-4
MFAKKDESGSGKEWALLEKLAMSSVVEQRRARRWGIFFKTLTFIYLIGALALFSNNSGKLGSAGISNAEDHTAIVRIHGPIMDDVEASAGAINQGLRDAFEADAAKAVVIAINSPGGSPVHAGYVYDEIVRLRALYPDKKVYAVISDLGASAAYYIAAAADEIYADKASLVGSIGVISASFGFTGAMEKLGVERRVLTAGENKAFLDPYQPWKADEKAFWQASLGIIHEQFIEQVRKGRGERLKDDGKLFGGYIWTGEQAVDKGLIDGLGSVRSVARDLVGVEELVDYSLQAHPLDKFMKSLGLGVASAMATQWQNNAVYSHLPKLQ